MKSASKRCASVCAQVAAVGLLGALALPVQATEPMVVGELTSQPIGHYDFCKTHPGECDIHMKDHGPQPVDSDMWRMVVAINRSVNASIQPMNDIDIYGRDEVWTYPDGAGDCEDYVLEKRRKLNERGISLSN